MAPQLSPQMQEHRQKRLLTVAMEVFAEKGYHDTSVDDILERAEIARGTFYRYFDNKRDCFAQALDYFFEQMMNFIRPLDISELSLEQYQSLFRTLSRSVLNNPGNRKFTRLVLLEAPTLGTDFRDRIDRFFDSLVDLVAAYIRKAVAKGRIAPIDPVSAAHGVLGLGKEALLLWYRNDPAKPEVDTLIENLLQLAFFGMMPRK